MWSNILNDVIGIIIEADTESFVTRETWKYEYSHTMDIGYEKSFNKFYRSIWNQLVYNQRLQLFVQSPQPYLLIFAWINCVFPTFW